MPQYCKTCREIKRTSVQNPPPKVKRATFNIRGSNKPEFCATHKTKDMVRLLVGTAGPCEKIGCEAQANFNEYGQTYGKFCYKHKLDGMVNVTSKKCEVCLTEPQYIKSATNPAPDVPRARYNVNIEAMA
jgi:EsV-1-7 cysteine-rich motif